MFVHFQCSIKLLGLAYRSVWVGVGLFTSENVGCGWATFLFARHFTETEGWQKVWRRTTLATGTPRRTDDNSGPSLPFRKHNGNMMLSHSCCCTEDQQMIFNFLTNWDSFYCWLQCKPPKSLYFPGIHEVHIFCFEWNIWTMTGRIAMKYYRDIQGP